MLGSVPPTQSERLPVLASPSSRRVACHEGVSRLESVAERLVRSAIPFKDIAV